MIRTTSVTQLLLELDSFRQSFYGLAVKVSALSVPAQRLAAIEGEKR